MPKELDLDAKTSLVVNDKLRILDSESGNASKNITYNNVKTQLKNDGFLNSSNEQDQVGTQGSIVGTEFIRLTSDGSSKVSFANFEQKLEDDGFAKSSAYNDDFYENALVNSVPRYGGYVNTVGTVNGSSFLANNDYLIDKWQVKHTNGVSDPSAILVDTAYPTGNRVGLSVQGSSDCFQYLQQDIGQLELFVTGETWTYSAKVTSTNSDCRLIIYDGTTYYYDNTNGKHSGGGSEEDLYVSFTLSNTPTEIKAFLGLLNTNGSALFTVIMSSGEEFYFTSSKLEKSSTVNQYNPRHIDLEKQLCGIGISSDGSVAFKSDQSMGGNKITSVASGTASTDAINLGQLSSFGLGLYDNGLINPLLTIDQYSTSFPVVGAANDTYYIDRWKSIVSGVTADVSLETASQPSALAYSKSYKIAATSSATGTIGVNQLIEDYLFYAGKEVTLSAWVKSNSTDARLRLNDGVTSTESSAHTGGGAWEQLSLTKTMSSSATASTCIANIYDNGTVSISSGDYIEVTGMKLQIGSLVFDVNPRPTQYELELCKRYYQKSYTIGTAPGTSTGLSGGIVDNGAGTSSTYILVTTDFFTSMRTTPTVTVYDGAGNSGKITTDGTTDNITPTAVDNISEKRFKVFMNSAERISFHYTATAEL